MAKQQHTNSMAKKQAQAYNELEDDKQVLKNHPAWFKKNWEYKFKKGMREHGMEGKLTSRKVGDDILEEILDLTSYIYVHRLQMTRLKELVDKVDLGLEPVWKIKAYIDQIL